MSGLGGLGPASPANPALWSAQGAQGAWAVQAGGPRILLVEDAPADADLVRDYLALDVAEPAHIVHVGGLSQARQALLTDRFDVALLDLGLPDGQGVEGVEALRACAPELPVVVLTGREDEALALACLAAGAQGYLIKAELQPVPLVRALSHAVARAAATAQRHRAEQLQARLAAVVEASADAIIGLGPDGRVRSWNGGAARIFGLPAAQALGQPLERVLAGDGGGGGRPLRERLQAVLQGGAIEQAEAFSGRRRDGRALTVQLTANALRDAGGRVTDVAVLCRDITEDQQRADALRRSHAQLSQRNAQMRQLAARLDAVREAERTTIAREVHDELGQLLSAIQLDLRWMRRRLRDGSPPPPLLERLDQTEALLERTATAVQRIAIELRPSALDGLGLLAAVRDELQRFEARSGIRARVVADGAPPTPPPAPVATAFFRILQELLANIGRHARAQQVVVRLGAAGDGWQLSVHDDGIGIDPQAVQRPSSLGLLGMSERALAIGGRFGIAPAPEGGTLARVEVPGAEAAA